MQVLCTPPEPPSVPAYESAQPSLAQCQHLPVMLLGDAATTISAFPPSSAKQHLCTCTGRSSRQSSTSRMCLQVLSSTDVTAALLKTAPQAAGGKLPRLLKSKAPGRGRRKVRECS